MAGNGIFEVNLATLEARWRESQVEASRELGIGTSNISDVVDGRARSALGYWFVKDDDEAVKNVHKKFHGAQKEGLWFTETGDKEVDNKLMNFVVGAHHDSNVILKVEI
jgi:hypothetical protein